jgi:hypothetical protein
MNQGGYLLITIVAVAFLAIIVTLTLLDVIRTRRQRTLAYMLLKNAHAKAEAEFREKFSDNIMSDGPSDSSRVDEMKILHDIMLPHESLQSLAMLDKDLYRGTCDRRFQPIPSH